MIDNLRARHIIKVVGTEVGEKVEESFREVPLLRRFFGSLVRLAGRE